MTFSNLVGKILFMRLHPLWALALLPILLGIWLLQIHNMDTHPQFGERCASVDWLPPEASNISYFRSYSHSAYEFDIPEAAFRRWADASWKLREIGKPVGIFRHCHFRRKTGPASSAYALVDHGLTAGSRFRNGGGDRIVFDRRHSRAYYQRSRNNFRELPREETAYALRHRTPDTLL